MPVRIIVTEGTRADCKLALALIERIVAEFLFADRGYYTNEIVEYGRRTGIEIVISPKGNRVEQREYDKFLYKCRHLVEKCFSQVKMLARSCHVGMQKYFHPSSALSYFFSEHIAYLMLYSGKT